MSTTMTVNSPILSAQERAIQSGRKTVYDVTARVERMFEKVRRSGQPRITLDRAVLFTESFRTTEGQPMVLRWARALKHITENIPVTIFEDELLVGRPNTWFGRYAVIYPELDGSLIKDSVEAFQANQGKPDSVTIMPEDIRIINEVLYPFWNGKDFTTHFARALPEESRFMLFGPDRNNIMRQMMVVPNTTTARHSQNWIVDHGEIINRGCKGVRGEAQQMMIHWMSVVGAVARLRACSSTRSAIRRGTLMLKRFLSAPLESLWCCSALMTFFPTRSVGPLRGFVSRHEC